MSDAFDPYHKWLGIPPDEQPPHHYRLLGISLFEGDADVISNAADQRMAHVRTFQSGKHSAESQRILNEISCARLCLLDPQKKAAYDAQLGARATDAPLSPSGRDATVESPLSPSGRGAGGEGEPQEAAAADLALAGKITAGDVAAAADEIHAHEQALHDLRQSQKQYHRRLRLLAAQLAWAGFLRRVRLWAERAPLGRLGAALLAVGGCVAVVLIAVGIVTLNGTVLLGSALLAWFAAIVLVVHALFYPPDQWLQQTEAAQHSDLEDLHDLLQQAEQQAMQAEEQHQQAVRRHQQLQEVLQSRRHRLLTCDWRSLRGQPFEDFLREVFEELGYAVEVTGKTPGDQGVDLLVARDAARIAVQAKGYAESVGNDAVQEVHTGMAFYQCHRCVVITNSRFTQQAHELAVQVGCMLIDGSQIPALLDGRIAV